MTKLAFVDTETTGLDPDTHEIWEVALIIREDDKDDDVNFIWQLPLYRPEKADPKALEINNFKARRAAPNALIPLNEFAAIFARLTEGAHLVGAVISFDEERLRRLLHNQFIQHAWHYHLIDVEALAAGAIAAVYGNSAPRRKVAYPPWNSNDLSLAVGVSPERFGRHTAMGDAQWARAIYDAVLGETI